MGNSNWRRFEHEAPPRQRQGRFEVTAAFSDLAVMGDGGLMQTDEVATARLIAWAGHAPLAHAREWHPASNSNRLVTRVDLFTEHPSPPTVVKAWNDFVAGAAVGDQIIMRTPQSVSATFSGSADRVPDGQHIAGAVAEIFVRFRDHIIYHQPCKTALVATARVASWLSRYPLAKVRETMGKTLLVLVDVDEPCPDELKAIEPV